MKTWELFPSLYDEYPSETGCGEGYTKFDLGIHEYGNGETSDVNGNARGNGTEGYMDGNGTGYGLYVPGDEPVFLEVSP